MKRIFLAYIKNTFLIVAGSFALFLSIVDEIDYMTQELTWDEVDYVNVAKEGILKNAFEVKEYLEKIRDNVNSGKYPFAIVHFVPNPPPPGVVITKTSPSSMVACSEPDNCCLHPLRRTMKLSPHSPGPPPSRPKGAVFR